MTLKASIPQILLALAITYLAYALLHVSKNIPSIINAIDNTTPHINTIVREVEQVRTEITQVRALVDKQLPAILMQIDSTLPLIEQGIAQSEQYASQLPKLWQHLDKIEMHIKMLQQDIPNVLRRVDNVIIASNEVREEVAKWRPHSTQYLAEIKHARNDVPHYLSRVENIVIDAKTIGKEASSGLVSGFFKGVISLPLEVISGLTGMVDSTSLSAKYLTTSDITIMQEKVLLLLENDTKKEMFWQNDKSGNRGTLIKEVKFISKGQTCHRIVFNNHFKGQQERLEKMMCKSDEDLWQVM